MIILFFPAIPPAEEEIVIDAMPAGGVDTATYINPSITMTLLEPAGCEFLPAEEDLRPNDIVWNFPTPGDNTVIKASVIIGLPEDINRSNSKSFPFAIKDRNGGDIKLGVVVTAQPVSVQVDSCNWTIDSLGLDTINLGGPLDDLPL